MLKVKSTVDAVKLLHDYPMGWLCSWEQFSEMDATQQLSMLRSASSALVSDTMFGHEHTVDQCVYSDQVRDEDSVTGYVTVPVCLVGQLLHAVGYPVGVLGGTFSQTWKKEDTGLHVVSWQAMAYLDVLQEVQDRQASWFIAVCAGRRLVEALGMAGQLPAHNPE